MDDEIGTFGLLMLVIGWMAVVAALVRMLCW
jgi:hypothetical protein